MVDVDVLLLFSALAGWKTGHQQVYGLPKNHSLYSKAIILYLVWAGHKG
jgi:hypothetical protein